ncbi:DNA-directed RNA polymerase III subunit RPC5 [Diabrotica virgifera virgifera]|uniref:DNA-directed RNA polymerase III subunit RPC5 n=1 Tax=Diabrotica virgifera virgifera TaxID=50390 RepID=A0ABM5KMV7_DIAVI|nr:DNA-directed RNA polymerase III subunit RPC5 [Diabrotica virgifera virgifera]
MEASTAADAEDDEIIKEIPIIHSKRLEDNLYLFQYPLNHSITTNQHKIKSCFFKPKNQEVKLELGIDTRSPNFDTGRAEIIAHEVDKESDKTKKNPKFFENEVVDKVFLQSSKTVQDANRYAVAVYNGKEVHLTSLSGVFQFRPVFPYMEKGLKRKKETDGNESDEEQPGPSSAQQVTVKFKSSDERWKKLDETSYHALQSKKAEEPWTECEWHEADSTFSCVERLKLMSDNTEDISQATTLGDSDYIRLLIPEDQEQTPLEPVLPSHLLSLNALRALPIQERCRVLLKDAQIIRFQQLLMLLTGGEKTATDSLLKVLPVVAVLVRGNWVVKSDVLYPANTFSATSGVPAELMCRARDYILYQFTKSQYVERKKVSSILKIPSEEIKEIFTGISKLRRHNKEWELHLPTDQDFINKHGDIVQKQNLMWEHRFHQLSQFLKDNMSQRRKSRSESKSVSEDGKVRNSLSFSSDNESDKGKGVGKKNKGGKSGSNQATTSNS